MERPLKSLRLSIRLPADLYERLVLLAMGRIGTNGKAELSSIVREALEQYIAAKAVRPTRGRPVSDTEDTAASDTTAVSVRQKRKEVS